MSYCRFIEADIYLYPDCHGGVVCCWCPLVEKEHSEYVFGCSCRGETFEEVERHIKQHIEKGHHVPDDVIDRLREDFETGFILPVDKEDNRSFVPMKDLEVSNAPTD